MYTYWKKKEQEKIKTIVFKALRENVNYEEQNILGVPASYLDDKVFSKDETFLKDAPFLSTMVKNPNHIGCHTLNDSEKYFSGTQKLEKELIEICAVDILKGNPNEFDGYVASGGTEANIQAIWIYRNFFLHELGSKHEQIAIVCSEDSHYSMDKASNLLNLSIYKVPVAKEDRSITLDAIDKTVGQAFEEGKRHFIIVANMMTTMFGSVDNPNLYVDVLKKKGVAYKIHVDGAYGGFYYPFSNEDSQLNFSNKEIDSIALDAHKMAQAPYGTGIFIARKGFMKYTNTKQASYVEGEDFTLIGSRSGANAVAIWMILTKNGPFGWQEKIYILQKRTHWLCEKLKEREVKYFRHPYSNIVTIYSDFISTELASKFSLVPDNHENPNWYKIVVMEHVSIEKLIQFIDSIEKKV